MTLIGGDPGVGKSTLLLQVPRAGALGPRLPGRAPGEGGGLCLGLQAPRRVWPQEALEEPLRRGEFLGAVRTWERARGWPQREKRQSLNPQP